MQTFTQGLERGLFNLYVLWKAARKPVTGTDILRTERKHGHEVSAGRVYPILHDLTERGYLVMEEVVEHGKVHKYYRTTDEGKELLKRVGDELGEPMKEFLDEWL